MSNVKPDGFNVQQMVQEFPELVAYSCMPEELKARYEELRLKSRVSSNSNVSGVKVNNSSITPELRLELASLKKQELVLKAKKQEGLTRMQENIYTTLQRLEGKVDRVLRLLTNTEGGAN